MPGSAPYSIVSVASRERDLGARQLRLDEASGSCSAARSAASPIVKSVLISMLAAVSADGLRVDRGLVERVLRLFAGQRRRAGSPPSSAAPTISPAQFLFAYRMFKPPVSAPRLSNRWAAVLVAVGASGLPYQGASCMLRPTRSGSAPHALVPRLGGLHCWHVTVALDARLESMSGTSPTPVRSDLTQEQALMRESVRRFASNEMRASSRKADEAGEAPEGLLRQGARARLQRRADRRGARRFRRRPLAGQQHADRRGPRLRRHVAGDRARCRRCRSSTR